MGLHTWSLATEQTQPQNESPFFNFNNIVFNSDPDFMAFLYCYIKIIYLILYNNYIFIT